MTLPDKNHFFKNILFLERINVDKLNAVINCEQALNNLTIWWEDLDLRYEGGIICNEKDHLKMMLLKCKKMKTGYDLSVKYSSKAEYGRVYPVKCASLGILRRPIRHFLAEDIYYDVDLINAHFMLCVGICEKLHYKKIKNIKKYIDKREETIAKYMKQYVMSRDNVKALFISMLNGGDCQYYINENGKGQADSYLKKFQSECREVCERFMSAVRSYEPDSLYNILTKDKVLTSEKKRSFMAKYLQIEEEKILKIFYGFAMKKNLIAAGESRTILCHDGAMIEKELFKKYNIDVNDFIKELNETVIKEVGMKIEFKVKDFDEGYKIRDILDAESPGWEEIIYVDAWKKKYNIERFDEIVDDDQQLAHLYYDCNPDGFVFCGKDLWKKNNVGMFQITNKMTMMKTYRSHMKEFDDNYQKHNNDFIFNKIMNMKPDGMDLKECKHLQKDLKNLYKFRDSSRCKIRKKLRNHSGAQAIGGELIILYADDDFEKKLDTDVNLLGFNNGVIDFSEKNFIVRPTKEGEYVSMTCGYDFIINDEIKEGADKIHMIIKSVFDDEEKTDYLLKNLAKCLRGENNKEEIAIFLIGDGGNGKGVIDKLMAVAMGDYHNALSYKVFTHIKADNRSVELYSGRNKRFNSISEPPKKFSFDADTFKLFTGGDTIMVRNNYDKKMTPIRPNFCCFQANHHIQFSSGTQDNAMIRRISPMELPYTFMGNGDYDPENERHRKRIPNLKENLSDDPKMKMSVMLLLLRYYKRYLNEGVNKPLTLIKEEKEYMKHISPDSAWFSANLRKAEIGGIGRNIVLSQLLSRFRDETKHNWKQKYFKDKLKEYGFKVKNGRGFCLDGTTTVAGNSKLIIENVIFLGDGSFNGVELEEEKEDK